MRIKLVPRSSWQFVIVNNMRNSFEQMHGGARSAIHLALLFNCFNRQSFLPPSFMDSVIIPVVKSKHGDLTNIDNYRAIMVYNSISKIFESILLDIFTNCVDDIDFQFVFKSGHSTDILYSHA